MPRLSIEPVGLSNIQVGCKVNNGTVHNQCCLLHLDLHMATNNFAPNEYRGVVNPSGLVVYKGSNGRVESNSDCNKKVKGGK